MSFDPSRPTQTPAPKTPPRGASIAAERGPGWVADAKFPSSDSEPREAEPWKEQERGNQERLNSSISHPVYTIYGVL